MTKFISLPNGTVINVATIVSVKSIPARISDVDPRYNTYPSVVVIFKPSPSMAIHEQIACKTDQEAIDLRDRIIARLNEHTPIISV